MKRTASPARRALLFALSILALGAPCCGGDDLAPSSRVAGLRVLAVTADAPYAQPGDSVTFRMTYADTPGAERAEPRQVEILWLGGCVNPPAGVDEHLGCLAQLESVFQSISSGGAEQEGLLGREVVPAERSGVPEAVSFALRLPDGILDEAEPTETGTVFSTAYVFFAVCAGTMRSAAAPGGAKLPLECVGDDGEALGPESFVVGYTQVYVFGDGRTNANPPIDGFALDGEEIEEGADGGDVPTVARCAPPEGAGEAEGCGRSEPSNGCTSYEIEALVKQDVAEVDVESGGLGGQPVREAVWVDYYADRGAFSGARRLVSDTVTGYRDDHATTWTPPSEPGLVSLWAVVHDTRGGASVTRRIVRVE
jgi:hypothetical protein